VIAYIRLTQTTNCCGHMAGSSVAARAHPLLIHINFCPYFHMSLKATVNRIVVVLNPLTSIPIEQNRHGMVFFVRCIQICLLTYYLPCVIKTRHFVFWYNSGMCWAIVTFFVPVETGTNISQFAYLIWRNQWSHRTPRNFTS